MWQEKEKALYRKFGFADFDEAFDFMQKVARVAKQQNHHPKWLNKWKYVEIWLSTHDAGDKITNKDHKFAQLIDAIYNEGSKKAKPAPKIVQAKLYTDGGARGNPGPAAAAYVICKMDETVVEKSGLYLGKTTNNQAEYQALMAGLERAKSLRVEKLSVYLDSELVVNQLNGSYKIKNQQLLPLYLNVKQLSETFEEVNFLHVPRRLNRLADEEVNRILDEKLGQNS